MRMKFLMATIFLALFSCGEREDQEKKPNYDKLLVGVWEMVRQTPTAEDVVKCGDIMILHSDQTVTRQYKCGNEVRTTVNRNFRGHYERFGDRLHFRYANAMTEIYFFTLDDNELTLVKSNQEIVYYRRPSDGLRIED